MAVVVKKTGRYRYKTHRVLNPDGSNVKLALKKKELDNLRIANTGQGRSITPSILSLISENEKVNVENAQPKFSLKAPAEETKDLIAVHNATEKNVRGLLGSIVGRKWRIV